MKRTCVYAFAILMLVGCAKAPKKETLLLYPAPPDEPKIAFVKSIRGEADFAQPGLLEWLFGGTPSRGLGKPYGVAVRGDKVYATLTGGGGVAVIDRKEEKVSYVGDAGLGKLSVPLGVAVTSDNILFISDSSEKKVYGFDEKGDLKIALGKDQVFENPAGIAVNDALKRLYIVDSKAHTVFVYSTKGEKLFQFGRKGSLEGEFYFPSNVAIDRRNGDVYVVDTQNFRVQKFTSDGKFKKQVGQIGDVAGSFSRPKGIGVDSEGNFYVTDAAFDNFQIFNENGDILLNIGAAGTYDGYFQLPAGVYIDENDTIYIVDQLNGRVQVFQYLSDKWKKAHPTEYQKYLFSGEKEQKQ